MKKLLILSLTMCLALSSFGQNKSKVEVYYFHLTSRCATCKAVEKVTSETLKNHFSAQMESGDILFKSINIENKDSKEIVKRLKVKGQSLLIMSGDTQTDLITQGYQYARSKPKDFEGIITKEIKQRLK